MLQEAQDADHLSDKADRDCLCHRDHVAPRAADGELAGGCSFQDFSTVLSEVPGLLMFILYYHCVKQDIARSFTSAKVICMTIRAAAHRDF